MIGVGSGEQGKFNCDKEGTTFWVTNYDFNKGLDDGSNSGGGGEVVVGGGE